MNQLLEEARESLAQAVEYCFGCQKEDGHWVGEVSADATFTAQYVMFKYAIPGLSLQDDGAAIQKWLISDQQADGSWVLAPGQGLPGNLSTTVESYLALRILGTPKSHPAMERARSFVQQNGGLEKARFFTRFFLATFGIVPWSSIPQMPAELILLPNWAFLNIYVLSSWSRSTLIPVLVVRHHEPIYALPENEKNDFLDELWLNPKNKNIPYAPLMWDSLFGRERDVVTFAFTLLDKVIAALGGLKRGAVRQLALRECIHWLFEHQEESGDWAGFFPPIHGSIWALLLEGYSLEDESVRLGMEALERLAVSDSRGKWLQATVSPVWDTGLAVSALGDAGVGEDPRVALAAEWLKKRQLTVDYGDWRIYANTQTAGGWSFEYFNTFYPDVDDSAVALMALFKQNPSIIDSECINNGLVWILGMQNDRDGGWGAFDINNDALWLHKVPFSDMDSLVDPSSADITGRMLECFGMLLANRRGPCLARPMRNQLLRSARRAILYLVKEQENFGGWWGRWGNNYIYGTTNVLRGLVWFASADTDAYACSLRAIRWLESIQNKDGGWGESLLSYTHKHMAGQGQSTAAQTAWALDSLLRFKSSSSSDITHGVQWLVKNQTETPSNNRGLSWNQDLYVGTGFPHVLYLGYPFYHHLFPIQALARYIKAREIEVEADGKRGGLDLTIPPQAMVGLQRPMVLIMAMGSLGDIKTFLSIARKLSYCRVRVATHPCHRTLVEEQGFEFCDVGGNPTDFSKTFSGEPRVLQSVMKGDMASLQQSVCRIYQRLFQASMDDQAVPESPPCEARRYQDMMAKDRPFVADIIVSAPATIVHVHAAEKLQVPLVLASPQPALPTKEMPSIVTMTSPIVSTAKWWNVASYFFLDLLTWIAFGKFLNGLRVDIYGMRPHDFAWAVRDFLQVGIPYICLWSSSVVPKAKEWGSNVSIAGFSSPDDYDTPYKPCESLGAFLNSNKATIALSLGSATVADPGRLIGILSSALDQNRARAVVCRSWSTEMEANLDVPANIYIADGIPHTWLLQRMKAFIHHGGAGHTAAGLRAGIPQLAVPQFLDQYLWAARIRDLGLGPEPLSLSSLNQAALGESIQSLLSNRYSEACADMANNIKSDGDGALFAAHEILRQAEHGRAGRVCVVFPQTRAYWRHIDSGVTISGAVAACLAMHEALSWDDLELEPGLDWEKRWKQAASSFHWTHILRILNSVMTTVVTTIHRFMRWVSGDRGCPEADSHCRRMRDPVRRARLRQATFDLEFIKKSSPEPHEVDQEILGRWKSVLTAAFEEKFVTVDDDVPGPRERADSVMTADDGAKEKPAIFRGNPVVVLDMLS